MKKISLLIATVVAMCSIGFTVPTYAHTPNISASCNGVVLKASAYDGNKANKWSVTIGGATSSGTFGSSFDRTFPVAQAGATTAWSATIQAYDGGYKQSLSGTVGPCGTPPVVTPPAPPAPPTSTSGSTSNSGATSTSGANAGAAASTGAVTVIVVNNNTVIVKIVKHVTHKAKHHKKKCVKHVKKTVHHVKHKKGCGCKK